MHLVVQEDAAARLQLVLVNEAEDGHVVLAANAGGDDGVVVVDNLLQVSHTHRCSSKIINLATLLFVLLLLRLQSLLISDELLLHQKIVFDPLLLEQPQPALGVGCHPRQLVSSVRALHTLALLTNPGWNRGFIFLLLLLLTLILPSSSS